MHEPRERETCWCCGGKGVHINPDPKPGKWFTSMGLAYKEGVRFESMTMDENRIFGAHEEVRYGGVVTDDGLSDGEYIAQKYNDQLEHDLIGNRECVECCGVGTVPKPLPPDERMYDKGELMAEAFMDGGMQGLNDMQDEWGDYVSGRGSHADFTQKRIEADYDRRHGHIPYEREDQ